MQEVFRQFANKVADIVGTVWVFALAFLVIVAWGVTGPIFKFSDTWQLIINTGTTIVTFLMVFLIQNTQNRDNRALHAKLDEIIVHTEGAHNEIAAAEDFTEAQLKKLREHFVRIADQGGTSSSDPIGMQEVEGIEDAHENNGSHRAREAHRSPATSRS